VENVSYIKSFLWIAGILVGVGIAYGVITTQIATIETEHNNIFQETRATRDQVSQIQIDVQKLKDAQGIK